MLIAEKVSIARIISGTWKHFLFNLLTCIITYLVYYFLHNARYIHEFDIPGLVPSILGTALAFFIGFKNNQAYDRWWEARKIWGGLVNDSRTWARQLLYYFQPGKASRNRVRSMIFRHIAFLYALKQALRKAKEEEYLSYLAEEEHATVKSESNTHNAILSLQSKDLNDLYERGTVDGFQFMEMNKMLVNFCDLMGKSERIANTVFPTTYNYYTRLFIWFFIVFVTLVTAQSMGMWSILVGTLIGYVFLTTYKIGSSILDPFEDITTGIPLDSITRTIEINLLEMMKEEDIPEPVKSVDGEYIM